MEDTKRLIKTFLSDTTGKNKLNEALEKYFGGVKTLPEYKKLKEIPFSSERKYSASIYRGITLILGAPEMLLAKGNPAWQQVKEYAANSYRVVVFGKVDGEYKTDAADLPEGFKPLAVIALDDPVRKETPGTLSALTRENIEYRIISGDSADTVTAVAKKINQDYPARTISGDELDKLPPDLLEKAILGHNIFARIKPRQKQLIVRMLKKNNLFTVMIGDGVNDVLALKESDLGVAMNDGSGMAKDVADVVLLDNSFATLPVLLYEGRRIIGNIQTIANIYLIKNISSIATILMLGFIGLRFPFDPKHVELASLLIIGIPSLMLAFEKHTFSVTDKGFIRKLIFFSGVVGFGNAVIYTILYIYYDLASEKLFYSRSMLLTSIIFMGINNIFLIYLQHYKFSEIIRRKIVIALLIIIISLFTLSLTIPTISGFFDISSIAPVDLASSYFFSLVGSMTIAVILKKWKLISTVSIPGRR